MCIRDRLYLEHKEQLTKGTKIEVIDSFGRLVLQKVTTQNDLIPIDVQKLNSGLLIVRITTEQGIVSKKVVLAKKNITGSKENKD